MRDFLTDIRIVGVTMAFREGELIKYCLDDLLKYCDEVLVQLDNYDGKTEKVVLDYQEKYKKLKVIYSRYPRLEEKDSLTMKKRLDYHQDEIRDSVLRELRRMNIKKKIDILLWPDGDEVFNRELPSVLEDFWRREKKVIYCGTVTPFGGFKMMRKRSIFPHCRIFKFQKEMTAVPYRCRCFYHPFLRTEAMKIRYLIIHLALLNDERLEFRKLYTGSEGIIADDDLFVLAKDIREMTMEEIRKVKQTLPILTIHNYLHDKEISKKS